jgi:hypothetical protein
MERVPIRSNGLYICVWPNPEGNSYLFNRFSMNLKAATNKI